MAVLKCPANIAFINAGRRVPRTTARPRSGTATPATPPHPFSGRVSASRSTARAGLRLVYRKLVLDEDVNAKLTSGKVPETDLTKTEKVTLRRLLSHTAGLTVSGFGGYRGRSFVTDARSKCSMGRSRPTSPRSEWSSAGSLGASGGAIRRVPSAAQDLGPVVARFFLREASRDLVNEKHHSNPLARPLPADPAAPLYVHSTDTINRNTERFRRSSSRTTPSDGTGFLRSGDDVGRLLPPARDRGRRARSGRPPERSRPSRRVRRRRRSTTSPWPSPPISIRTDAAGCISTQCHPPRTFGGEVRVLPRIAALPAGRGPGRWRGPALAMGRMGRPNNPSRGRDGRTSRRGKVTLAESKPFLRR